jgi:putative endonuclease
MAKTDDASSPQAAPKVPAPARIAAFRVGLSAEASAAALLIAKGYFILARRYRTPYGEIDLVAHRRNLVGFVEVKTGPSSGMPPMR